MISWPVISATCEPELMTANNPSEIVGQSGWRRQPLCVNAHPRDLLAGSPADGPPCARPQTCAAIRRNRHEPLANADNTTKRTVLDILEINITVTESRPCPECARRGLAPSCHPARTQRRGHTGDICPTCRRHKYQPVIEVRGLLPEIHDFPPVAEDEDDTIPFTLRSVS